MAPRFTSVQTLSLEFRYAFATFYLFSIATRAGAPQQHAYANYCGPVSPKPSCLSTLPVDETGIPGENPQLSAKR